MCQILVLPIMQDRDYPTAGNYLYRLIMKTFETEEKITLDMEGVTLIPSMFLNTSIGRIIQERGTGFVKTKISFANIQASDAQRVRDYVKRFE